MRKLGNSLQDSTDSRKQRPVAFHLITPTPLWSWVQTSQKNTKPLFTLGCGRKTTVCVVRGRRDWGWGTGRNKKDKCKSNWAQTTPDLLLGGNGAMEGRPPQPLVDLFPEVIITRAFSIGAGGDEKH